MESAIIPSYYSVGVSEMPYLICTGCGDRMEVNIGEQPVVRPTKPERLIGSAICRSCQAGTGFELENNIIVYVSGKGSYGSINASLSDITKALYAEAEMCFRSGSPNACAAMCRASIEAALNEREISGRDLYEKINNAKDVLGEVEVGLAHASRLITRDAIHREELIPLSDIPSMLSATVRVLNKLAS